MEINFAFPGRVDRMEKKLLWRRKIPNIQGCCVSVWGGEHRFLVTVGLENGKVNNHCKPHSDRGLAISVAEEIALNMGATEKVFG